MKIFDFNIHLPNPKHEGVVAKVESEINATHDELISRVNSIYPLEKIDSGNFMIFNSNLYQTGTTFNDHCKDILPDSSFTLLVDFRSEDCFDDIDKGIEAGINCIKFHSYHQKINVSSYEKILEICKYAESKGLIICLDASYGTSNMIRYDIIDFICTVANVINNVPLVALHSGGLKCLDIMLLALDKPNVWVEMSASLPVYMGSTIENDLAFMYRKLDPDKILWATDAPYFDFDDMLNWTQIFFNKYNFPIQTQEDIMYNNAMALLNK